MKIYIIPVRNQRLRTREAQVTICLSVTLSKLLKIILHWFHLLQLFSRVNFKVKNSAVYEPLCRKLAASLMNLLIQLIPINLSFQHMNPPLTLVCSLCCSYSECVSVITRLMSSNNSEIFSCLGVNKVKSNC